LGAVAELAKNFRWGRLAEGRRRRGTAGGCGVAGPARCGGLCRWAEAGRGLRLRRSVPAGGGRQGGGGARRWPVGAVGQRGGGFALAAGRASARGGV